MQLALIKSLVVAVLIYSSAGDGAKKRFIGCLPAGVSLEEPVSAPQLKSIAGTPAKRVTVRDALPRLKARCKKGKLIAGGGREIRYYGLRNTTSNLCSPYS